MKLRRVAISNLVFHTPNRLSNSLAVSKALNMSASDATNFVKANEIKPTQIFAQDVVLSDDEIINILNDYHITCNILEL